MEPLGDTTKDDEEWVKTLTQDLRVKVNIKHMARIGAKADGKKPTITCHL